MISHRHHASVFHARHMSKLGRINVAHTIRVIALSLIGVFVPIYLYKTGYDLTSILMLFMLQGLFWALLIYPTMLSIGRYGAKRVLVAGNILSAVYAATLVAFEQFQFPLWILALSWGAMVAPYWFAYRVAFSSIIDSGKAGQEVSLSAGLNLAGAGLAPLIGGILASSLGIGVVYGLALGLCIGALAFIFDRQPNVASRRANVRNIDWRKAWPDIITNGAYGVDDALQGVVWPLLIFLVVPSYAGVGALSSVIVVSSILVSLYVGRREATRGERHYMKEGSILLTALNGLRILVSSTTHVFGVNLISGVSHALIDTPYMSRYYRKANAASRIEYIFGMQMAAAIVWFLYSAILVAASLILPQNIVLLIGLLIALPMPLMLMRLR